MIPLLVFYVHVIAIAAMFTKRWQDEGLTEGILAVFFMGLIFFVGWSISSYILKFFMEQEGLGLFLDRDAASLLLLTAGEAVLYYYYFRGEEKNGAEVTGE
ncbi:MAG TPA: hypothetical protein VFG32_00090 [Bacteroidota bacterium]|nr:hypothetical protein [Bacteroidota bacterium]